jgi:hypothetical protein
LCCVFANADRMSFGEGAAAEVLQLSSAGIRHDGPPQPPCGKPDDRQREDSSNRVPSSSESVNFGDGFNITPTHLPGGCEDFVELVVPELQRRGLFRTEYEGKTLRENLGLKRPVSRYAAVGLDRNLDAAK